MQRFFSVAVSAVVLAISSTNAQQQMDDVQTWAKVFDNNTVTTGLDGS